MLCKNQIWAYMLKNKFYQVKELWVEYLSVDNKLDIVLIHLFCKPVWNESGDISIFDKSLWSVKNLSHWLFLFSFINKHVCRLSIRIFWVLQKVLDLIFGNCRLVTTKRFSGHIFETKKLNLIVIKDTPVILFNVKPISLLHGRVDFRDPTICINQTVIMAMISCSNVDVHAHKFVNIVVVIELL